MKARTLYSIVLVTIFLVGSLTYAEGNKSQTQVNTYETIELNRLIGIASDNHGLRVSCAFNLGEMKSEKAIIPLMALLRDGQTDEEKIIAALSLMKIGAPQGVYMVGRSAKFNDSGRVRYICEKFYNGYLLDKENAVKAVSNSIASM